MSLVDRVHDNYVVGRRARILSHHLSKLIPEAATVLDVGCGDGLIASLVRDCRPDLVLKGIDVLLRPKSFIPIMKFDGKTLPFDDASVDCVLFVDVLHHMHDPMALLCEAARVVRQSIIIKDHAREGFLGHLTLRVMDKVGNERHGVSLPYNYWTTEQWLDAWNHLGLQMKNRITNLGLYPWPATLIFDRSLHFVARLDRA